MILYVSYRFRSDFGAAIHLDILKEIYGAENVFIADLQMGEPWQEKNRIAFGKYKNLLSRIAQWLQGNTMYISNATIQTICDLIGEKKISRVFIEDSVFGNLAKEIKKQYPDVPITAFFHDIVADLYRQKMAHTKSLVSKIECLVAIRQERIQQKYVDTNVVFSKRDTDLYRKYYKCEPDAVIPLSAYVPDLDEAYLSGSEENSGQKHLLFVGTQYWPNIVGIRWFYEHVLPEIQADIVVDIVGRGTEFLQKEFTDPRVKVHGTVDSIAEYYLKTDAVIIPLFDGGGMKMKAAEAISYGKCIISTAEGLVGFWDEMDVSVRDQSVFLCNTAQQWCDVIETLCGGVMHKFHPPLYALFQNRFSYDATKKALTDLQCRR